MKKKSIFLSGLLLVSCASLIIGFSVTGKNVQILNAAGSSAVQPLLSQISNVYSGSDVVTQAGGSGAGIQAIANGTKDIGMASKNPWIVEAGVGNKFYNNWKERKIKTITIAWDGIGIIYKSKNKNDTLDINNNTINNLYRAFAGFETLSFKQIDPSFNDNTTIVPYARTGGSEISGTAGAFADDSHLTINIDEKIKLALKTGIYGPRTITTAETNSQVWNFIKEKPEGTITYLSTGYILNNKRTIEQAGFKIATYNNIPIKNEENKYSNVSNGYDWFRPLNLMISLLTTEIFNANKEFINAILNLTKNPYKIQELIENEGYINLTESQKASMGNGDISKIWDCDDIFLGYSGAKSK